MAPFRPYRFPPLSQALPAASGSQAAQQQAQLAQGFQQGMESGFREGYDSGVEQGRQQGLAAGHADGLIQGAQQGEQQVLARFAQLEQPLEAALQALHQLQADYQQALRREVVELVAKVARQVIRCELALQPVQLLALVDETLAALPPVQDDQVTVYLNAEECQRIRELAPERAARWTLTPDARLAPGECRVRAGNHEADAGCRQRLDACMQQVADHLADTPSSPEDAA
ncbi:flagellar assembly protein FliH [Vogesella sp. LIG4]|uniref:flagellar assembly protein FliH n=1 Tax=Vogesella sp. LIG4 TaxID=1192162 RepID=UPI00082003D3|nr:flagellar assembly protein FliH [Vogesella sp. LIG4]SCK17502.1 flagellar assembly protein FliH [Vogesella sp. LIG4]